VAPHARCTRQPLAQSMPLFFETSANIRGATLDRQNVR
jgi:hypothetical protein